MMPAACICKDRPEGVEAALDRKSPMIDQGQQVNVEYAERIGELTDLGL